jgi:hypothetical protein
MIRFRRVVPAARTNARPGESRPPDLPEDASAADRVRHERERHNSRVLRYDSLGVGVTNAATPFLPVLVARLGGSSLDVGLITVVPASAALLLALPIGAWLEGRPDLVRWFSASRLVAWLGYGAIGLLVVLMPAPAAVPAILFVWIAVALPATVGQVAFTIVMNDAAGAGGRYELLGRRWATMGLSGAVAVAATGWLLDHVVFPTNYGIAFAVFAAAGVFAARAESQIRLVGRRPSASSRLSIAQLAQVEWADVLGRHRSFVRYLVAHVVVAAGIRYVTPVVTLFYVRGIHASDAAIGLIATASAIATFGGYHGWRRVARRRGGRFVLLASSTLTAAYPAALALAPNPLVAGVIVAAGAAGGAGLSLALFDELMRRVPPARAIAFTAADYAAANAVGILAPLAGAIAADALGLPAALALGGVVGLGGVLLFARDRPGHAPGSGRGADAQAADGAATVAESRTDRAAATQ